MKLQKTETVLVNFNVVLDFDAKFATRRLNQMPSLRSHVFLPEIHDYTVKCLYRLAQFHRNEPENLLIDRHPNSGSRSRFF